MDSNTYDIQAVGKIKNDRRFLTEINDTYFTPNFVQTRVKGRQHQSELVLKHIDEELGNR